MAEPWCPEPQPDTAGAFIEPRCWCGFTLGRDGTCPWHGLPRDERELDDDEDARAAA